MFRENKSNRFSPLTLLRLRWFLILIASLAALWVTAQLIQAGAPHQNLSNTTSRWIWGALMGLVAHLGILWWGLDRNHRRNEPTLLTTLGYGNGITILRGVLISLLAGFLFISEPTTALAWLPAIFYATASILDFLDGYVARLTNHTTILGEVLDMEFDGLGILIAIGVAIRYGQLPPWYLILGFGRQLFLLGIWLRQRRGLPTFELTESGNRRIIAGFQMGFISVILWPILTPPLTTIICILFSIPLAASFGRDWLVVSGHFDPASEIYMKWRQRGKSLLEGWGPLACRVVGTAICGQMIWVGWPSFGSWMPFVSEIEPMGFQFGWRLLLWVSPFIVVAFLLGILSRLCALLLLVPAFSDLLAIGPVYFFNLLSMNASTSDSLLPNLMTSNVLLLIALVWVLQFGGGTLALWAPEESVLHRRAGG